MAEDTSSAAANDADKPLSRIQLRNRKRILDAALDVFSAQGFRGATLDEIAERAGMSKPNMLYYFDSKEDIHVSLLNALMAAWLAPLEQLDAADAPIEGLMRYIETKLEMSRRMPRESRLFANEILQGAPRMGPYLSAGLKPLFDAKCALIRRWIAAGQLADIDVEHFLFTVWAVTQHYADFEAQVDVLQPDKAAVWARAKAHVDRMFRTMLTPPEP